MRGSGVEGRPQFPFAWGCLTVFPSFGWRDPLVHVLQGVVEGELEAGIGEDGNQGGGQAFVEDQGALGPVHGGHGVPQGFIHLDSTHATRVSARWFQPENTAPPRGHAAPTNPATRSTIPAKRTKNMLYRSSEGAFPVTPLQASYMTDTSE